MKAKVILLLTIFSALLISGANAQKKSEIASVVYAAAPKKDAPNNCYISVSKEGSYEKYDVEAKEGGITENLLPVLEVLNKFTQDGWEIISINTYGVPQPSGGESLHMYYFLRREAK